MPSSEPQDGAVPAATPAAAAKFTLSKWLAPVLAFLLVAGLATLLLKPAAPNSQSGLIGKAAPAFELSDLNGQKMTLAQWRGQPVVLNFWATWCEPCRNEMPELQRFQSKNPNIRVVGVLYNEGSLDNARRFVSEHQISYPQLQNPSSTVNISYGIKGIPATFFIDAQGMVRHVIEGQLSAADLSAGARLIQGGS